LTLRILDPTGLAHGTRDGQLTVSEKIPPDYSRSNSDTPQPELIDEASY
jgi:hypothetical protein